MTEEQLYEILGQLYNSESPEQHIRRLAAEYIRLSEENRELRNELKEARNALWKKQNQIRDLYKHG